MLLDDNRIIELFFQRSETAISSLAEKYGGTMYSISYNILKSSEDAEECVNDAYLGAWNAIPPARPSPLLAFVCRIVRNISLTRYKFKKASKRDNSGDVSFEQIADCIPADSSVDGAIETAELTRILDSWLSTLKPENRYIFMRRFWYMDTVFDIAKSMNISEASVYQRIDRMKKKLYIYLKERGVFI